MRILYTVNVIVYYIILSGSKLDKLFDVSNFPATLQVSIITSVLQMRKLWLRGYWSKARSLKNC